MGEELEREPLLAGRGVVLIEDFCRRTGLTPDTVEHLMRTELSAAALWRDEAQTRPIGLFDDMLPSRGTLAALALPVREDYEPDDLRGLE